LLNIADILAEAREYLEKHRWTRYQLYDARERSVCSMGAICYSQRWYSGSARARHSAEIEAAAGALVQALGKKPVSGLNPSNIVIEFNDEDAKDKQEVLDVFAKAEKIARTGFDPDKGIPIP
jgi:hypothetical protein